MTTTRYLVAAEHATLLDLLDRAEALQEAWRAYKGRARDDEAPPSGAHNILKEVQKALAYWNRSVGRSTPLFIDIEYGCVDKIRSLRRRINADFDWLGQHA